MAEPSSAVLPHRRRFPWWIVAGAVVLPCLYLPTLATRFDFIDDGNLVYPEPPMPLAQRLERVWDKIAANYEHLGPFRPVLWAHWEVGAELFGAKPLPWRLARLLWMMLATGMFLWLLRELGIGRWPALATVALAMWNPYRNEIWTSLTLSEGVAMPYGLLSLVCAIRAARSRRPTPWDIGGALCVLAALGCKNTFAALVPAQFLLRIAAGDSSLSDGLRRHGRPAALLSLTLLFPIIHYIVFRLTWHPGQYVTGRPSFAQLERMCSVIAGALSLDFLGVGLAIAAIIIVADAWQKRSATGSAGAIAGSHRVTLMVGVLLLFAGVVIYLPLDMVSGRYAMPAVWGADIGIAVLLSRLREVAMVRWRRWANVGLVFGLIAVAVSNVGRQDKFAARARMLWRALEYVEREAPAGTCLAWVECPELNTEEGIHFYWHLHARTRRDLMLQLLDADGEPKLRPEQPATDHPALWVLGATPRLPLDGMWKPVREFTAHYWLRTRAFRCYLLQKS